MYIGTRWPLRLIDNSCATSYLPGYGYHTGQSGTKTLQNVGKLLSTHTHIGHNLKYIIIIMCHCVIIHVARLSIGNMI